MDDEEVPTATPAANIVDTDGKPILSNITNVLISYEMLLPQGEVLQAAKVLQQSLDENGQVVGAFNDHPLLNTLIYNVEFPDEVVKKYTANMITENVLTQVDPDGF